MRRGGAWPGLARQGISDAGSIPASLITKLGSKRMAMCKHANCTVLEEFIIHDIVFVNKGVVSPPKHDMESPMPTGLFFVKCSDCGLERSYGSRKPKWLERILDESLERLISLKSG